MPTERFHRPAGLLVIVGLVAFWGCASRSALPSDIETMRALTGVAVADAPDASDADLTAAAPGGAALPAPLDAEAAVRIALRNNRALRARLHELGIARGRRTQAGAIANPTLEFEVLPERDSDYELRVEYEVSSLLLAPLRAGVADAELEAERHRVAAAVVQLGYAVRSAIYALQAAERRRDLTREALAIIAASRDAAETLHAAGNLPPVSVAAEIAAHEEAHVALERLELEVADRREDLQRLLGLHGRDTAWRIDPRLPAVPRALPDLDAAERRAIEHSHDLAALKGGLEAASRRTRLSRTEGWLPDVSVDVHALQGTPEDATGPDWRFGGGVSISVPLFDRRQGALQADEAAFDATLDRYQDLAIRIRSDVRSMRNRVFAAHRQVRRYEEIVLPAQRTLLEQTLLQYNAMQIGVFELLRARRQAVEAQLGHLDALRDYWTADAALHALLEGARVNVSESAASPAAMTSAAEPRGDH